MDSKGYKFIIDSVCAVTTDRTTLRIAEWAKMRPEGQASKFLHHYLDGWGTDVYINIETLLREDPALRETIEKKVVEERRGRLPKNSGTIPLPQPVFSNQDWRYATGSINMDWKLVSQDTRASTIDVELSFRNQYRWHPNEPRVTQCVHQAAEGLKKNGARDFWMIGRPAKIKIVIPGADRSGSAAKRG